MRTVTCFDLLSEAWSITHPTEYNPYAEQATAKRPSRVKLDITKISDALGFTPQVSLRECLEEVLGMNEVKASERFDLATA